MNEVLTKYTNDASRFVVVEGMLIHYRDEGTGPVIVLLHGAFSSLHTFDAWTDELKKEYRVIRYDLPGFGLTGPHPRHNYSIASHTRVLDKLCLILGVDHFVLAGSSLGGWISWEYTLKHPNKINKLILLDAAGFLEPDSIPLPFRMARTPFVDKVARFVIRKNVLEGFVKQVYGEPTLVTSELVDRYYDLFSYGKNPEAFFMMVNKVPYIDNSRHLVNISVPTLLLWGETDVWIPVEYAHKFLKSIPIASLVIFEGVGHLPMEEAPEESLEELYVFLADQ